MKTNVLIFGVLMALCYSCSSKQREPMSETREITELKLEDQTTKASNESSGTVLTSIPDVTNKKIIKDGNMSIKTKDVQASKKNMDVLLKQFDGYYETENLENNDHSTNYNLKIRLPAQSFDAFVLALEKGEDEIKSKNIQARDVTEEYIDVESRLNNERAYLSRYKVLLSKASSMKDILLIEENIRKIQEEIESREGRLNYLKDQIAFSSLAINLYKDKPYKYTSQQQDPFGERIKRSLNGGWKFTVGLVLLVVSLWPLLIIATVVVVLVKRARNKRKNI